MKETRLISRFSEKNSHLGKWAILVPKIAHPHNSGSTGRIFLKFCTMEGANRQMRIILIISKKKIFKAIGPFWAQKLWICWKNIFSFCTMKKGQQLHESNNNGLYPKKIVQHKWVILGPKMAYPHNSGLALRIFVKFCRMKGLIGTLKFYQLFFVKKESFGAI